MILLALLDILFVALIILTLVTQVLFPALAGLPLFPFFRRRRSLESKLAAARESVAEAGIENAISEEEKRASALRKQPTSHSLN